MVSDKTPILSSPLITMALPIKFHTLFAVLLALLSKANLETAGYLGNGESFYGQQYNSPGYGNPQYSGPIFGGQSAQTFYPNNEPYFNGQPSDGQPYYNQYPNNQAYNGQPFNGENYNGQNPDVRYNDQSSDPQQYELNKQYYNFLNATVDGELDSFNSTSVNGTDDTGPTARCGGGKRRRGGGGCGGGCGCGCGCGCGGGGGGGGGCGCCCCHHYHHHCGCCCPCWGGWG